MKLWLAYGVIDRPASDSRWHEAQHDTAFRTPWMSTVVYHVACFMIVRNPLTSCWSHARHRTDTYIVGRGPETAILRPAAYPRLLLETMGRVSAPQGWRLKVLIAMGRLHPEEATYLP